MNFSEARDFVRDANKFGSVLGLDSMTELLRRLDNPERQLNIVHFAGTNGKGSTICFIEKAMLLAGYSVGKYTSPAVFEYLEIVKINGENLDEISYAKYMEKISETVNNMVEDGLSHPTSFEIETALAFLAFHDKSCDIVLLETGMGGLTDATNVISSNLCSVITSISMDHMNFLGDTIEKIAEMKSGIIKKGCPVVKLRQEMQVMSVVEKKAMEMESCVISTGEAKNVAINTDDIGFVFDYVSDNLTLEKIKVGMAGEYQINNAMTAIETLNLLENKGYKGVKDKIREALFTAIFPGRFETVSEEPLIIIDGAHNPGAADRLEASLQMYFTNKKIAFIMGVLADKDYELVAERIIPHGVCVATVTPDNPRALKAEVLAQTVSRYCDDVYVASSVKDALDYVVGKIDSNEADMVIAFGSLSYLHQVKDSAI